MPTPYRRLLQRLVCCLALLPAVLATPSGAQTARSYRLDYLVRFLPGEGQAEVTLTHTPGTGRLTGLSLQMPLDRYPEIRGEGELERRGNRVAWRPLRDRPSRLTWRLRVDHERHGDGYDARLTARTAILRCDDLVPPAEATVVRGSRARARLRFALPRGWSYVDTPYPRAPGNEGFVVEHPDRGFERPVGWMIAGEVGSRRDRIADAEFSVAAPRGEDVRRNDILGFLHPLAPEMRAAFGRLPDKLLIVSAGDPMWRGGLSGPNSLFLHADRPLISENGSSTLVHELVHVVTRVRGAPGDDWIAEGLAEYYSIELTHRAGLLSDSRRERAFGWMQRHGRNIRSLHSSRSRGERTARAVVLLRDLDRELRERSRGRHDLDAVVRALMPRREISRQMLREEVRRRLGGPSRVLETPLLAVPAAAAR